VVDFFFGSPAGWFTAPALIGTVFFGIRMVTALLGLDSDHGGGMQVDLPADVDVDMEVHASDDIHTDPGDSFKVLSVQSVAAFCMGFGWAGLGGLRGSGWGPEASVAVGVVGGVGMVWLLGWLLRIVYDLQTSGNIPMVRVVGHEGDVYVTVPAPGSGAGRVRVVVEGRQRFYPAMSVDGALERGARVRVERVSEDRMVMVRRA